LSTSLPEVPEQPLTPLVLMKLLYVGLTSILPDEESMPAKTEGSP
jgi:hypothetical protein